jgi:hypothetical protein
MNIHEKAAPRRVVKPRPGRLWRWLRHAGIVACFVVLYLGAFECVLVVSVLATAAYEDWQRPELCATVPGADDAAAAYAFADRVYTRFPVGTPWQEVKVALDDEGFAPVLPRAGRLNPGGRFVGHLLDRTIWCEVRWTSGADGGVTSVRPLLMMLPRQGREALEAGHPLGIDEAVGGIN